MDNGENYSTCINGFIVEMAESDFTEEKIAMAEQIIAIYAVGSCIAITN